MSLHLDLKISSYIDQIKGTALKCIEGVEAGITLHSTKINVICVLPDVSVTESRWLLARLISHLQQNFKISHCTIRRSRGITRALFHALCLDMRATFSSVDWQLNEVEHAPLKQLSDLELSYRAWVDEDPSTRTSLQIARDVCTYADTKESVHAYVLEEDQLAEEQMNLLLAVGQASTLSPPRLIVATYGHPDAENPPLMLVGKGITFDSGGLNVKPYESFVSMMKNDMGGSALAWHLFKGLVESDFPQPVVVVIPSCENPIDAQSMRPGSVVTGHRGVSVRIDHTDAEGRLILADALSWASEKYHPSEILTFATLTTAALIAYGPFATPVHFASNTLQTALTKASVQHGEDLHFFPNRVWHREANRDHSADVKNTGRLVGHAQRAAGSRNAAHFLKYFTDYPLTHFDIFASTWDWSGQAVGTRHGATGSPLRTLLTGLKIYGSTS